MNTEQVPEFPIGTQIEEITPSSTSMSSNGVVQLDCTASGFKVTNINKC